MKAKRITSAILCLIMAFALLPATAFAYGDPIKIGGVGLDAGDYYVNGANGASGTVSTTEPASWNAHFYEFPASSDNYILELNDLVLNNESVVGNASSGIYVGDNSAYGLTLKLTGDNSITTTHIGSGYDPACGVYMNLRGGLTVTGDGSLTVEAINNVGNKHSTGIYIVGSLTVESGTLFATGNASGISSMEGVTIKGGEVTAIAKYTDLTSTTPVALNTDRVEIEGGTLLAVGGAQASIASFDLSGYTAPHVITVSQNESGSPEATYAESDIATYKYFRIAPPPVTVDGLPMTATATQSSYYVNGIYGNQGSVTTIEPASWNAKLELVGGEYKLTLKELKIIRGNSNSGIKSNVDLNLHLGAGTTSNNSIYIRTGTEPAIDVTGDLLITSENTDKGLWVGSFVGNGVNVTGDLRVNNNIGTFFQASTSKEGCAGINVGGDLLVETGSRGEAFADNPNSDSRGVKVGGNVVMNGDSLRCSVFANGGAPVGISLEAGGSIALNNGFIHLRGGAQASNKEPDLSAHTAYVYSIDNGGSYSRMPYAYSSAHTDLMIYNAPSATITDVTVSGTVNTAIAQGYEATIALMDWSFNSNMAANTDVTGWFTNLPAGITAKIKEMTPDIWGNFDVATVTFSGTPTAASAEAMEVTIPANQLDCGLDLTVDANAGAKWAITSSTPPGPGGSTYDANLIASETVYNAERTVWLTGGGFPYGDMLITERNPSGSAYKALLKLADGDEVFGTYNIYLRSGRKSTGSAMYLHFDLAAKYAGQVFTLVHQKADGTYEYFNATADMNGDLTFGPLYELSPFLLAKESLLQAPVTGVVDLPKTGDREEPLLWLGIALIAAAAWSAATVLSKRRQD